MVIIKMNLVGSDFGAAMPNPIIYCKEKKIGGGGIRSEKSLNSLNCFLVGNDTILPYFQTN